MSRRLEDLHPDVAVMARTLLAACEVDGIDLLCTCTWRSHEEQAALYAQGRTAPGKIVTNAKPGQSSHNHTAGGRPASLALDVVPLRNGKAVWNTTGADGQLWKRVGELGEQAGLAWAGRWTRFKEYPHFEHPRAPELRGA